MTALVTEDFSFVFYETCCSVRTDYRPRRDGESEESVLNSVR